MTDRKNPFREFERLFEQMQDQFEEAARTWGPEGIETGLPTPASPRVDLEDRAEEFVLSADLPGFETDDIDVRVTDRTLHLEAERADEVDLEERDFVRRERRRSSVSRSIRLPEAVETEEISATYDNGVLTVRIPKREPTTEGTEIDIE